MRKTDQIKLILFIFISMHVHMAFANWERISTKNLQGLEKIQEMQGVFKGYGKEEETRSYLVVYRIDENDSPSGKFNVFLMRKNNSGNSYRGAIFEGEMLSRSRIALLPIGLTNDRKYLRTIDKAVATLEIRVDSSRRRSLLLTKMSDSNLLPEHFYFNKVSEDYRLGPKLPMGTYEEKYSEFIVQSNSEESATINVQKSKLNLNGLYHTVFEMEGLMVMRKEQFNSSLLRVNQSSEIQAILVSLMDNRERSIILMKPNPNGEMQDIEIVEER